MSELTSLPGQIMHSATAEKIVQPAEVKAEAAAQQAAQATEEMVEAKRLTVQEPEEAQEARVDEDRSSKREQERQKRQRRQAEAEAEDLPEEEKLEQGRLIDVMV